MTKLVLVIHRLALALLTEELQGGKSEEHHVTHGTKLLNLIFRSNVSHGHLRLTLRLPMTPTRGEKQRGLCVLQDLES